MFEFSLDSAEHIRRRVKYLIQTQYKNTADFYFQLYDTHPDEQALKTFELFLKRGEPNPEFMQVLAQKTKIGEVSLRRLFDVNIDNAVLFADE